MIERQNGKISVKQSVNLLVLELFSVLTLFLPGFLGKRLSGDAITGYAFGCVCAFLYVCLLIWFWNKKGTEVFVTEAKKFRLMDLILILFFIQLIWATVFGLNMAGEVVRSFLLPDMNYFSLLFVFFMVCVFGVYKGVECRGRMAEFLGIVCLVLFLVFLLISVRKIDFNQYETLLVQPGKEIIRSGYEVFILFQFLCLGLFSAEKINDKAGLKHVLIRSFWVISVLVLLLLMVLLGIFGSDYMGELKWPAIQLLRNITESGNFTSRLDIFMISIWLVSFFFFVSGGLLHSSRLFEIVFGLEKNMNRRMLLYLFVFLLAWLVRSPENAWFIYKNYMCYVGTLFIVISLLLGCVFSKKARRKRTRGKKTVKKGFV